jgi:acyl dehydratase
MVTRELDSTPRIVGLYARTVAPLLPGASRLPWVGGAGREIPDLAFSLPQVRADPGRVAEYSRVCAFPPSDELPATYPHVLAFPLHLALMADRHFPFAAVGLVHMANRIAQQRPLEAGEPFDLRVHATGLRTHPRGRVFSLVSEARVADELVWWELSTMLRREARVATEGTRPGGDASAEDPIVADARAGESPPGSSPLTAGAEWRLAGDLGRRYAAVSNDRNPIHLHALSARALGFPRAIAHGMWTKARCLAALQEGGAIPSGAFTVEVAFRRPILLPASVRFASRAEDGGTRFDVHDAAGASEHLGGRLRAIEDITRAREEAR